MGEWVDFKGLRQRVSLEDVLFTFYKLDSLKRDGPKITGACPVHGGDSPRAFSADLSRNVWHCFTKCQAGGNQLDFVAKRENISVRDAALKLQAYFESGDARPATPDDSRRGDSVSTVAPAQQAPRPKAADEVEGNKPIDLELDVKGDHPHLLEVRKLSAATVAHFRIGYCSRGIMKGTIAIPIHDEEGELVGYAGRRLKPADIEEHGKYKLPKGFKKDVVLWNLHRVRQHLGDYVLLVEGFFSAMKLHELGFPNVVAAMGCSLSEAQARLLADAKEVIIIFDGNEAGWKGATAAKDLLSGKTIVRVIRLPSGDKAAGFQPEDCPVRLLRWLVNGARQLDLAEVSFLPSLPPASTPV